MAANTTPIFIKQGNFTPARIAAANTASDGSGTLVTLVTAVTDGTRVDGVRFINSQATAAAAGAKVYRIFLSDTAGANPRLIGEVAAGAATRSTTAIGQTAIYTFDQPIIMKSSQLMTVIQSVYAGVQDQTDACAFAGDY
ncbi:MAG: hypothetical protein RIR01_1895 [Bacteroidota bacterium]|jgi:hypothetical protein